MSSNPSSFFKKSPSSTFVKIEEKEHQHEYHHEAILILASKPDEVSRSVRKEGGKKEERRGRTEGLI